MYKKSAKNVGCLEPEQAKVRGNVSFQKAKIIARKSFGFEAYEVLLRFFHGGFNKVLGLFSGSTLPSFVLTQGRDLT